MWNIVYHLIWRIAGFLKLNKFNLPCHLLCRISFYFKTLQNRGLNRLKFAWICQFWVEKNKFGLKIMCLHNYGQLVALSYLWTTAECSSQELAWWNSKSNIENRSLKISKMHKKPCVWKNMVWIHSKPLHIAVHYNMASDSAWFKNESQNYRLSRERTIKR